MDKSEIIEEAIKEFYYDNPPIGEEQLKQLAQWVAKALREKG